MKAFSQDSLGLELSQKKKQKVRHHLFTPIPQYCINKFWITCFTHTFLTKPPKLNTIAPSACQHTKLSSSNRQNLTQLFPLGKSSLYIPEQFGITGQKVNTKHSAFTATNDNRRFATQLGITFIK